MKGWVTDELNAPASDEEIEMAKRRVEACMADYEEAVTAAQKWATEWKFRQRSRGFKCVQEQREL